MTTPPDSAAPPAVDAHNMLIFMNDDKTQQVCFAPVTEPGGRRSMAVLIRRGPAYDPNDTGPLPDDERVVALEALLGVDDVERLGEYLADFVDPRPASEPAEGGPAAHAAWQERTRARVEGLANTLLEEGWNFVALTLGRLVADGDDACLASHGSLAISGPIAPALPTLAKGFDSMAARTRRAFELSKTTAAGGHVTVTEETPPKGRH